MEADKLKVGQEVWVRAEVLEIVEPNHRGIGIKIFPTKSGKFELPVWVDAEALAAAPLEQKGTPYDVEGKLDAHGNRTWDVACSIIRKDTWKDHQRAAGEQMIGSKDCFHCGGAMQEVAQTRSGRIIYQCPDCYRRQFYDGAYVPSDLITRPLERSQGQPAETKRCSHCGGTKDSPMPLSGQGARCFDSFHDGKTASAEAGAGERKGK